MAKGKIASDPLREIRKESEGVRMLAESWVKDKGEAFVVMVGGFFGNVTQTSSEGQESARQHAKIFGRENVQLKRIKV